MVKMLKSNDAEAEERQISRIKKEIEFLSFDLQGREEKLQRIKQK
jgi:hypothetical protein